MAVNIKLKPKAFGKFKITENVFETVKAHTHKDPKPVDEYYKKHKNHASVIVDGDGKNMLYTIPIFHKGKMFFSEMHLPPILYFNLCIDFKNITEYITELYGNRHSKDVNKGVKISDAYYNTIVSYKIASIIFLHTGIDATVNYLFPDDFRYFSKKANKEIGKLEFEDLPFMDKVKEFFREVLNYNICDEKTYNLIDEINNHRKNFIHLNTTKDNKSARLFFNELGMALNIDMNEYINPVINLFKKFRPDLFETVEFLNHYFLNQGNKEIASFYYPVINEMTMEDFEKTKEPV